MWLNHIALDISACLNKDNLGKTFPYLKSQEPLSSIAAFFICLLFVANTRNLANTEVVNDN
jgi:hypothetical protein